MVNKSIEDNRLRGSALSKEARHEARRTVPYYTGISLAI